MADAELIPAPKPAPTHWKVVNPWHGVNNKIPHPVDAVVATADLGAPKGVTPEQFVQELLMIGAIVAEQTPTAPTAPTTPTPATTPTGAPTHAPTSTPPPTTPTAPAPPTPTPTPAPTPPATLTPAQQAARVALAEAEARAKAAGLT
jgi:hypothetical protein